MKANKNFKLYAIIWFFGLVIFNAVTFIVPAEIMEINRFEQSLFWVGYYLITITFIGQLVCSYIFLKEDSKKRIFLRFPLLNIGYTMLFVSIIVGTLFMIIPIIHVWIGAIVCLFLLFLYVLAAVKAVVAAEAVETVGKKVDANTAFMKLLAADAESLGAYAKTPEIKKKVDKVYEAIKYSDPVSNDSLTSFEAGINNSFSAFSAAVKSDDTEAAKTEAEKLLLLINDRNKKCRVFK